MVVVDDTTGGKTGRSGVAVFFSLSSSSFLVSFVGFLLPEMATSPLCTGGWAAAPPATAFFSTFSLLGVALFSDASPSCTRSPPSTEASDVAGTHFLTSSFSLFDHSDSDDEDTTACEGREGEWLGDTFRAADSLGEVEVVALPRRRRLLRFCFVCFVLGGGGGISGVVVEEEEDGGREEVQGGEGKRMVGGTPT